MTSRAAVNFVYHAVSFALPTPLGFAQCRRADCREFVNIEQFVSWSCKGTDAEMFQPTPSPSWPSSLSQGGLRCVLCGEPVMVEPMHREYVRLFGVTCNAHWPLLGDRPRRYYADGSGYQILNQPEGTHA